MPRAAAARLRSAGWEVLHVGELAMAAAKDAEILKAAQGLSERRGTQAEPGHLNPWQSRRQPARIPPPGAIVDR